MSESFWTKVDEDGAGFTSVKNLPQGCLVRVVAGGSVSVTHLQGLIFEDGDFRALTMEEMLGKDLGGMMGQMNGLMSSLNKFR